MKLFEFKPKLVSCLKNYSKETFMADPGYRHYRRYRGASSGYCFRYRFGSFARKGIITAIIAGFIISLLGGSKVQIGGPTGAFIVIIYGIIQQYGEAGLIVATLMAGVLCIIRVFKPRSSYQVHPLSYHRRIYQRYRCHYFTTQIADIFGLSFGDEKVPERLRREVDDFISVTSIQSTGGIPSLVLSALLSSLSPRSSQRKFPAR